MFSQDCFNEIQKGSTEGNNRTIMFILKKGANNLS